MKRALKMAAKATIYHYAGGQRAEGPPDGVTGDLSHVRGDLSGVWGDLTCVRGDLSGVRGNFDDCEITPSERAAGVNVRDLIAE